DKTDHMIHPAAELLARRVPDAHLGPVIVVRDVEYRTVEADLALIEPVSVVNDDLTARNHPPDDCDGTGVRSLVPGHDHDCPGGWLMRTRKVPGRLLPPSISVAPDPDPRSCPGIGHTLLRRPVADDMGVGARHRPGERLRIVAEQRAAA